MPARHIEYARCKNGCTNTNPLLAQRSCWDRKTLDGKLIRIIVNEWVVEFDPEFSCLPCSEDTSSPLVLFLMAPSGNG
jgi:hypothetical protein